MRELRLLIAAIVHAAPLKTDGHEHLLAERLRPQGDHVAALGSEYRYGDERDCTPFGSWASSASHLAEDGSDCQAVVAHRGQDHVGGLAEIRRMLPSQCSMVVYDKSPAGEACGFMPMADVDSCIELANVGREQNSFVEHMRRTYDQLPKWLILLPNPMDKHGRRYELQRMLNASVLDPQAMADSISSGLEGQGFSCIDHTPGPECDGGPYEERMPLISYSRCRMDNYYGRTIPASPPHLGPWLEKHVPASAAVHCHLPLCHFGVAVTTRENVHVHPLEVWENLAYMSSTGDNAEVMFYMEWAAGALYGTLAGRATASVSASTDYYDEGAPGDAKPSACRADCIRDHLLQRRTPAS